MPTRRLRSGYDWFGIATGWGLVGLGGLMILLAWLATVAEAFVASPGYIGFGGVLAAFGVVVLTVSVRNGVRVDARGIRIVRPLRRAVWIAWPEVDRITVIGRGSAFAAQAIVLTDGTRVLTPLTERDRRLPQLWRQVALRRDTGAGGTGVDEPGEADPGTAR